MSKSPFTIKLLKGKEPFLRRLACELRFRDGQLYIDKTGRLLKKLVRDPSWVISNDPTPKGTNVFHLIEGVQLSFNMNGVSLDLDRSNTDEMIDCDEAEKFITRTSDAFGFVIDELEVTEFTRIGFRQWYYLSFDSKDESEQWLRDIGLFSVDPKLLASFNAIPESLGVALVMQGQECHFRIALNGVERMAQLPMGDTGLNIRASAVPKNQQLALAEALKRKRQRQINSAYTVVLDIDSYRRDQREPDLEQFLGDCLSNNLERFRSCLSGDDPRKGKK